LGAPGWRPGMECAPTRSPELGAQRLVDLPAGRVRLFECGEEPSMLFMHGLFMHGLFVTASRGGRPALAQGPGRDLTAAARCSCSRWPHSALRPRDLALRAGALAE
jgi:hypothetical protein